MTNKEKSLELCNDPANDYKSTADLCIMMAEWKNEQIIKKAIIWLTLNADVFGYFKKSKLEDMITNFQKAMKEE